MLIIKWTKRVKERNNKNAGAKRMLTVKNKWNGERILKIVKVFEI